MITSRFVEESDRELLQQSLDRDSFHPGTKPDVFFDPKRMSSLYSDDQGPVLFVRGSKCLRLDLCCVNNMDTERNRKVLQEGFFRLAEQARANGFLEIVTSVNGAALLRFLCKKVEDGGLGFEQINVDGEIALRRTL